MPTIQATQSTDSELLSRFAQSRDEEAFASLMKKHWGFVFSIARRSLENDALAEDATQQTFIALSKRAGKLSKNTALGPWLFRAVSHEASNLRRREQRLRKRNHDYATISDHRPEKENQLSDKLYQALANLSEKDRELVLLRFYEGLTADQIATRLKISPAAAQRRTHRALERLSAFANSEEQEPESFQLSLPLLLAPAIKPPKSALSDVVSSKAAVGGSLLLPAAGWILATTLSVSAVKQIAPEPTRSPEQITVDQKPTRTRTLKKETPASPLPDDPDIAQFITLARAPSGDPFAWSSQHFSHLMKEDNFLKKAFRYITENDLPLAETLLETREDGRHRHPLIEAIATVKMASDIPSAILWMESLPHPDDHQTCCYVNTPYHDPTERFDQYEQALKIATKPVIRTWLAGVIATHYQRTDETKLLAFADTLTGKPKAKVLNILAQIQLNRDHPMAYDLIREMEGDLAYTRHDVVRRNPGRFLEASLPFIKNDPGLRFEVDKLLKDWFELDPDGFRAWATEKDPTNILKLPPLQRAR